jgi:hypothetical protein
MSTSLLQGSKQMQEYLRKGSIRRAPLLQLSPLVA